MFEAKVITWSKGKDCPDLITLELEYPLYIHGEFMTHRVFSRNAQSNRAIPVEKLIERIINRPVIPLFTYNQKGMEGNNKLCFSDEELAKVEWLLARDCAIASARTLLKYNVHKQHVNRLLMPFQTVKVIVSSTEWDNFFRLRLAKDAQPEIQELARLMKLAMDKYPDKNKNISEWHLPYICHNDVLDVEQYYWTSEKETKKEFSLTLLKKISVARCARVSYLNHDKTLDVEKDIELFNHLLKSKHMSPFEHVAVRVPGWSKGNFEGWKQHRYDLESSRV